MSKKQSASWRIVLRSLTNNNFPSSLSATDGQASFSLPRSETKFLLLGFGGNQSRVREANTKRIDQLLNKVLAVFLKNHWLKIRVFCIKFPLKIIKQLV